MRWVLPSYRAVNHMLHMAVKLRGNERGDFFSTANANLPANSPLLTTPQFFGTRHYQESGNAVYNSQWAEVVYFLQPISDTANGQPLYALYRRQLLLVPDNSLLTSQICRHDQPVPRK